MKTRRFAIAFESGRVSERRAHAWGLVSRIMVRRDGGGSEDEALASDSRSRQLILSQC